MERWAGRVAVVTGASSGIGEAIAVQLVKKGMVVVGVARRLEVLQKLSETLQSEPGKLYPLTADLTSEEDILSAFKWIESNLGRVDVMVNNAGIALKAGLVDGRTSYWRLILDTNVLALSICTREAVRVMRQRGVDDGHVIHINSMYGHYASTVADNEMYAASKHAVTALTEGLRRELVQLGSGIRVTSISPGFVDTPLLTAPERELEAGFVQSNPLLLPEDIAGAALYALGTPPRVQVHEIIIRPVGERY
ncbi:farnesol dehydrogenase-like isoform X2 [Bacillus rossius redtenbacheri]|uniref:farnesol dehydrogenase-like isoform X2 n=1 Tax=Bacillus rossius redtenbacheri TaxID=93214 RepID=UPI002FDEF046